MSDVIGGYIFYEIAALLVLAAAGGLIGIKLRQPLIVSFIAVGILAGPSFLDIAQSDEHIDLLGELGIAVLLFLVGLKLDLGLVRNLGPAALITGTGQIIATFTAGFLLCLALGLDSGTSILVSVGLCFSSTIIIVKLLSDKREIDSLHGQIALGVLIVQDIVVVITMIVLSGLGGAGETSPVENMIRVLAFGTAMLAGVGLFVRFIADPLVTRLARTPELLLSFAIGWAALLAAIGHYFGLGKELGGLLAGVSFASTPFREAIAARLASLRDFLLLFFFVALGASLNLSGLGSSVGPALAISLFVLLGKPLIVFSLTRMQGYSRRTGILASLTLAQISEFSLIFMAMAVTLGRADESTMALLTLVALITITISSSAITYSHQFYGWLDPKLIQLFSIQTDDLPEDQALAESKAPEIMVIGLGRYGSAVAKALQKNGRSVLGVDFNPVAVNYARAQGVKALFGDATDPEFLAHLPFTSTRWIVSAIPEHEPDVAHDDPRRSLVRSLRSNGFKGQIAVAVQNSEAVAPLKAAGTDLILMPYRDAATEAADLILTERSPNQIKIEDPEGQQELV